MKFRRLLSVITVVITAMAFVLMTGCQDEEAEQPEEMIDYEIAFITDDGLINDKGVCEAVWNSVTDFGATRGISHKYYKATEAKANAVKEVLDTAVNKGAKVVIVDSTKIANIILKLQDEYKDINFITINTDAYNPENGDILIKDNTVALTYATEQAGYMAGYAAVKEGYTQLGCMVEDQSKQMVNFQYGFAKGANRAAKENGETVTLKCVAFDMNNPREEASKKAAKWYQDGTEVIFACGDKIESEIIEQAETYEGTVIGGITDKGEVSDTVAISAVEDINSTLQETLQQYVDGKFPGGEVKKYGVAEDAVSLDYKNSRLKNFIVDQYNALYEQLKDGEVKVRVDDINSLEDLELSNVEIK